MSSPDASSQQSHARLSAPDLAALTSHARLSAPDLAALTSRARSIRQRVLRMVTASIQKRIG